jgi:energy-coupling factor transporter transmembrane protein EcfT
MIHTLTRIDHFASTPRTPWHRASALAKLVLAGLLIGLAVVAPSPALLIALHLVAWTLALSAGLPSRLLVLAAGYPIVFAALFIAAHWDGTWRTPLLIALRPLTASLAAVWLIGTTPYPDVFAPLARVLPRATGDGLFLTYRALFELVARQGRLDRARRLRGGAGAPWRRRLVGAGEGAGTLVLYAFERSRRLADAMTLRGRDGRICGCRHWLDGGRADALVAGVGVLLAGLALALWRIA